MSGWRSLKDAFFVIFFLTFAHPAPAAKTIRIEILNLTWTLSPDRIVSFHARAILPNGDHAILICHGGESECGGLHSAVLKNSGCDRERMVVICTATDLGYFSARRDGNDVLIHVPKGKLISHISGSW
jgi:hypothetical protein